MRVDAQLLGGADTLAGYPRNRTPHLFESSASRPWPVLKQRLLEVCSAAIFTPLGLRVRQTAWTEIGWPRASHRLPRWPLASLDRSMTTGRRRSSGKLTDESSFDQISSGVSMMTSVCVSSSGWGGKSRLMLALVQLLPDVWSR